MATDFVADDRWTPTPFTPRRRDWPSRENLPQPLSTLVGLEREIAAISNLLLKPSVRLVVLTGPGGVGKTRLGIRIASDLADEFDDGVYFVPLAAVTDPQLVPGSIAQSLGLIDPSDEAPADRLRSKLRDMNLLLLMGLPHFG